MPAEEGWQLCHPPQTHRDLPTPAGCCGELQHHQDKLVQLDPHINTTRGVVMGCPLRLPTELLLRHPQIEEATRCQTLRTKEATCQVTVTLRGPLLSQLSLGSWWTLYLCPWVPEPLQCYRCHRFGHHQASCANVIECGICSGSHDTQECLVKYKAKQDIVHRCPNCNQAHHAWSKSCPARLRLVERGRERQATWVANQQKTEQSRAAPSTQTIAPLSTTPSSPCITSSPQ